MTAKRVASIPMRCGIVVSVSMLIAIALWLRRSGPGEVTDSRYQRFTQLVADGREVEALELGDSLYYALLQENPDDSALVLSADRLEAARQIKTCIVSHIQQSQTVPLKGIADMNDLGLSPPGAYGQDTTDVLLPPAGNVYWTHLRVFAAEPTSRRLTTPQVTFYEQYYDLRMWDLIMGIGRHAIMADPDSSEHACYVMALPLLYLHGRDDAWDRMEPLLALLSPDMLDVLSSFALLQAERPQAAMALARYKTMAMGREFSATLWASDTADTCVRNHRPDLADELLRMISADAKDRSGVTELRLKIADGYAQCADCNTAAQRCRQILNESPDAAYGRIMATYLGYLAKEDKAGRIVTETETVFQDPRCQSHLPLILYLRWWALRKTDKQDEAARTAQRLIEQYPGNPCVAPVLLERATDALARQDYDRCRELLSRLAADFGDTESGKRAGDILARLNAGAIK